MATVDEKLLKAQALRQLGQKVYEEYATKQEVKTISDKVDGLISTGGEPNVIDEIDVNGVKVEPNGKKVNITVPQNVSDLENDSKFQSDTQVSEAIQAAIAKTGHAVFKKVDKLPEYAEAEDNVLYLLKNDKTQHYDIYAKVDGSTQLELLDDTTVDLTAYATTEKMNEGLAKKAEKVHEHNYAGASASGGSANSAEKLDTDTAGDKNTPTYFVNGVPTACAHSVKKDVPENAVFTDTTYSDATTQKAGLMSTADKEKLDGIEIASDDEVTTMLSEIFSPAE